MVFEVLSEEGMDREEEGHDQGGTGKGNEMEPWDEEDSVSA